MNFMTFHSVGNVNVIIPTDKLHLQRGRYTTNQESYQSMEDPSNNPQSCPRSTWSTWSTGSTGWCLEHVFFPYIGNVIIPTDFHIFQRGRAQPPTSQHLDGYTIRYENLGNPSSYLGELHGPHWSRPKPGIMGIGWNWVSFRPQVLQ